MHIRGCWFSSSDLLSQPSDLRALNIITAFGITQDQLVSCTSLYVEDQLSNHFPLLVDFVKKAEQQFKRLAISEGQPIPNFSPAQVRSGDNRTQSTKLR